MSFSEPYLRIEIWGDDLFVLEGSLRNNIGYCCHFEHFDWHYSEQL